MGNDGGTIAAKRADLVKTAASEHLRKEQLTPEECAGLALTTCALSSAPLAPPLLCDELGALYNKEAVMEAVVAKTLTARVPHLRSMKADLFAVTASAPAAAPGGGAAAAVAGAAAERTAAGEALFACPVTGLLANGRYACVRMLADCLCLFRCSCHSPFHITPLHSRPQVCGAAALRLLGVGTCCKCGERCVSQLRCWPWRGCLRAASASAGCARGGTGAAAGKAARRCGS